MGVIVLRETQTKKGREEESPKSSRHGEAKTSWELPPSGVESTGLSGQRNVPTQESATLRWGEGKKFNAASSRRFPRPRVETRCYAGDQDIRVIQVKARKKEGEKDTTFLTRLRSAGGHKT